MRSSISSNHPACSGIYNRFIKRILDISVSAAALLLIWPLFPVIALAILLEDGLPVFYRAERGGYLGKPFRICKFRSMIRNADWVGGGTTAFRDSRITKVGNILRKTKLDELPQLWQVLSGKMSIVGPRPELMDYVRAYTGDELEILNVLPGITDFASVEYINLDEIVGSDNAVEMYETLVLKRKNALRIQYARTVSFTTDVRILGKTIAAVLRKAFGFLFRKEHR